MSWLKVIEERGESLGGGGDDGGRREEVGVDGLRRFLGLQVAGELAWGRGRVPAAATLQPSHSGPLYST